VAGIAGARPRRPLTTILTAVPAWPWLLLLAALLAPAVFVELPLRVGNRRVQVAGLYEVALLVSAESADRCLVGAGRPGSQRLAGQLPASLAPARHGALLGARLPARGASAPLRVLPHSYSDVSRRGLAAVGAVHAPHAALTRE